VWRALGVAAVLSIALAVWGFWVEPGRLVVRRTILSLPNWPAGNDGLRVAVLTDLHVGSPRHGIEKLRQIVAQVNSLEPDAVLILGDLVIQGVVGGRFVAPEVLSAELVALESRLGAFAVLGNHDWWLDAPRVAASLEAVGITLLEDASAEIGSAGRRFWLAGVSDYWEGRHDVAAALSRIPASDPIIVFTHNPDVFPDIPARVALTVAGHTHGGQVNIPLLGPPIVPSKFGQRYAAGHVVEDGRHLFVSTGTGTSILPVRFRVPPEITLLELRSDDGSAGSRASAEGRSCEPCTITRTPVVSFEDSAFVGLPTGAVLTTAGGYVVLDGGSAVEFSATGELVGRVPRHDDNPADRPTFSAVAAVGADSLIVADNEAGLLRVFGADRVQTGSVRLPDDVRMRALRALEWPGQLIFSGYALGRHDLFRSEVSEGFLIIDRQFRLPENVAADGRQPDYQVAETRNGDLWVVEARSYTLLKLGANGELLHRVDRNPGWFDEATAGFRPAVRALSVDEEDRVWVYTMTPTDRTGPAWRSREARRAGGTLPLGPDEMYDTVIEVLDPRGHDVIARGSVSAWLAGILPDGRALFYSADADGTPQLSVQQLRLK
jgi:hypothetical protein